MIWLFAVGAAAILVVYFGSLFVSGEIRKLVRGLRWLVGGAMMAGAAFLGVRGQMMIASLLAAGGIGVLMRGRLGPIDFGAGMSSPNTVSTVSSQFFSMRLDHDTGSVSGTVRAGHFKDRELAELTAQECWALYDEASDDPDSIALFESWLDANRSGWREYFAAEFGMETDTGADEPRREAGGAVNTTEEAYEILGLAPGASPDAIRAAHRALMKKMHPDAGGSAFLAAKINQAKDMLLKHADASRKR